MRAKDIMTSPAVTVGPDSNVGDIADLLLERRISAVPVVDDAGRLRGIVSEGDLVKRIGEGEERARAWWLRLISDPSTQARQYVKNHGRFAHEIMTSQVVTVTEDAPAEEIARILEERTIKRVPVIRDGQVVGIVSRANLLRGLAATGLNPQAPESDEALRRALDRAIDEAGIRASYLNIIVSGGVAHLWGAMESRDELDALRVILENVSGLKGVESHLTVFSAATLASMGGV